MATRSGGDPVADRKPPPTPGGVPSGSGSRGAARAGAAQRRAQVQADLKRKRERQRLGIIALAALVIAGGLALASNLAATGNKINETRNYPMSGTTKGDPNAPVTVTDWSDFQ